MVTTCCIPGCRSGYKSSKNVQKVSMFRIPSLPSLKSKWVAAIPRTDWSVTKHHRVCSLHFNKFDYQITSTDNKINRRTSRQNQNLQKPRLKTTAVPHIFPGLPKYLSSNITHARSSAATSSARLLKQNVLVESAAKDFLAFDEIDDFQNLKEKVKEMVLSHGYILQIEDTQIIFHRIDCTDTPKLLASVIVLHDLSISAFVSSVKVACCHYEHLLKQGHIKSYTALSNVLAHCKTLADKSTCHQDYCIETAVYLLNQHMSHFWCTGDNDTFKNTLLLFLIEQLQLLSRKKGGRRYSSKTTTMAFLWQMTSTALYQKLREVFILPAVSRLRMHSSGLSVGAGVLDLRYLKERTEELETYQRIVTLMIDEVYTAKRIEYNNGSFVGLTEDGSPAKTVLAFMVQSACSDYKDVVCLVPVNRLDTTTLHFWFKRVMEALNDIFLVIAVCVDNHVCNRKLFVDLCGGELKPYIQHPTKPEERLFLLFDFTHNFKNMFNNFVSKVQMNVPTVGFSNILGDSCNARFDHIKQLYAIEESKTLKIAHALKKVSLNPSNVSRTSPQHALSIFSESTALGLEYYGKTYPDFCDTARYIKFVVNLWKVMSVKSPFKGCNKRDDMCCPLRLEGSSNNVQFLCQAKDILKAWKLSGKPGLTKETFTACIQSIEGMIALSTYLISNHGLKYILPGKFSSDPIEGRFGWYRQVNGGNFFMSINQLFQAERKIRSLSLLKDGAFHQFMKLVASDDFSATEDVHAASENLELIEYLVGVDLDDISDDDASVTYYVSGYVGRSISRRRKCQACRDLLLKDNKILNVPDGIENDKMELLQMADRGGLSAPSEYCFAVCSLAVHLYSYIVSNHEARKKLFTLKNQRSAFIHAITTVANKSNGHKVLVLQKCLHEHSNFAFILQVVFNCFAKNELKRLNHCNIDEPLKMTRTVRKLTAKGSKNC